MEKEAFDIWEETYDVPGLPAILYGKPSPNLLIYIHGEHETEFNEEELAEAAEKDGFQFLSVTMEDVQNHVIWNGPRFDMRVVENYTHFRWVNFDTEIVYHLSCRADDWTVPQTLLGRAFRNSYLEQRCGVSAGQSLQPPWSGSQTGSAILRTPGWWRQ